MDRNISRDGCLRTQRSNDLQRGCAWRHLQGALEIMHQAIHACQ